MATLLKSLVRLVNPDLVLGTAQDVPKSIIPTGATGLLDAAAVAAWGDYAHLIRGEGLEKSADLPAFSAANGVFVLSGFATANVALQFYLGKSGAAPTNESATIRLWAANIAKYSNEFYELRGIPMAELFVSITAGGGPALATTSKLLIPSGYTAQWADELAATNYGFPDSTLGDVGGGSPIEYVIDTLGYPIVIGSAAPTNANVGVGGQWRCV